MRKLVVALAAGAIGLGVVVPSTVAQPTGGPGEPTCEASVISYAVQVGHGRREAAEFFFGDYPRAVQTAEFFLQEACAG
jgi:hypothetical protein